MNSSGGGRELYNPSQRLASMKKGVFTLAPAHVSPSKLTKRVTISALFQFGALNTEVRNVSLFCLKWLVTLPQLSRWSDTATGQIFSPE